MNGRNKREVAKIGGVIQVVVTKESSVILGSYFLKRSSKALRASLGRPGAAAIGAATA
jgi:hypothetical protein